MHAKPSSYLLCLTLPDWLLQSGNAIVVMTYCLVSAYSTCFHTACFKFS